MRRAPLAVSLTRARPLGRLAQRLPWPAKAWLMCGLAATLSPSRWSGAAGEWEQLDRAHIAGGYALGKRHALLQDASGLLRAGAQIALVAVGAGAGHGR